MNKCRRICQNEFQGISCLEYDDFIVIYRQVENWAAELQRRHQMEADLILSRDRRYFIDSLVKGNDIVGHRYSASDIRA